MISMCPIDRAGSSCGEAASLVALKAITGAGVATEPRSRTAIDSAGTAGGALTTVVSDCGAVL
jgi:hypothetical protein